MKSTPTRGVKQYLKPSAYNQSELDWTLMTIFGHGGPDETVNGSETLSSSSEAVGRLTWLMEPLQY